MEYLQYTRGMSSNFCRVGKMLVCAILYLETCLCIMLLTSLFILVSVGKQCRLTLKENLLNTNREDLGQRSASQFTQ